MSVSLEPLPRSEVACCEVNGYLNQRDVIIIFRRIEIANLKTELYSPITFKRLEVDETAAMFYNDAPTYTFD